MPRQVFLHGVPDTPLIWEPLRHKLGITENQIAMGLPGFGGPLPENFGATADDYLEWLEQSLMEIHRQDGPVDLVGHDWGGGLVWGIVIKNPELIRTWTIISSPIWPDYDWHHFAKIWRTPILGELSMLLSSKKLMSTLLRYWRVPKQVAEQTVDHIDPTMRKAILRLYRSAENVGNGWNEGGGIDGSNGLLIFGEKDPFMSTDEAQSFAREIGLAVTVVEDAGHWLIAEKPVDVARILTHHWSR